MKVFLTGGTGFIGAHVVKTLSSAGHSVTVLARNPNKATGLLQLPRVRFVEGELSRFQSIKAVLTGHDALVHIALHWGDGPEEMLLCDTLSSVRLFEAAADAGITSVVYTSSTSVNDWVYTDETAIKEGAAHSVSSSSKPNPVTYYGATKGASELFLNAIAFQRKLRANVIRPGYTFGNPAAAGALTQGDTRFLSIAKAAAAGHPIPVVKNDGTQFIEASDLSKIYLALLESNVQGRVFFGLGAEFVTWEEVAKIAVSCFSSKSEILIEDTGRPSTPALFDVSDIKNTFGMSFTCREKIADHLRYLAST